MIFKFIRSSNDQVGINALYADVVSHMLFSPLDWLSRDYSMTIEDVAIAMQADDVNWPPGNKPSIEQISYGLVLLVQAGLAEVIGG